MQVNISSFRMSQAIQPAASTNQQVSALTTAPKLGEVNGDALALIFKTAITNPGPRNFGDAGVPVFGRRYFDPK